MKCRNCQDVLYRVKILTRNMKQQYERNPKMAADAGFPVELTCVKCGHIVKAWIVNEQLKEFNKTISELSMNVYRLKLVVERKDAPKRTWLDKLLGR